MERFHRQDNMSIVLASKPGRGICLEFRSSDPVGQPDLVGNQRAVLDEIVQWTTYQVQDLRAVHHRRVKKTHLFFQGRSADWLLIEFWTKDVQAIRDFCLILAGKFNFEFSDQTS